MLRRSQLFVPANDEKKIRKSTTLSTDSIIFDLEDSVPDPEKESARALLSTLLQELDWGRKELCLRVNKVGHSYSKQDIEFARKQEKLNTLVLPKAEELPGELHLAASKTLIPLVETAKGIIKIEDLVRTEGVAAVSYGPADLAYSVGGKTEAYSQNNFVKTKIVLSASSYGIESIDGVYFALNDAEGFRREATESKNLGYIGKHVIHPSQIAVANEIYGLSESEVQEAKKLVEIYERASHDKVGALRLDDKLVDAVHYRKASAILKRAKEISESANSKN